MEVILLEDVKALGKKGEKVTVSEAYARNVILKKKLGLEATPANLNNLKLQQANEAKLEAQRIQEAKDMAKFLEDKIVTMKIRTGEGGRIFGSVSTKEVAQAVTAQLGIELDKKKMVLSDPIKSLGNYQIPVKIYKDVTGTLTVKVTGE